MLFFNYKKRKVFIREDVVVVNQRGIYPCGIYGLRPSSKGWFGLLKALSTRFTHRLRTSPFRESVPSIRREMINLIRFRPIKTDRIDRRACHWIDTLESLSMDFFSSPEGSPILCSETVIINNGFKTIVVIPDFWAPFFSSSRFLLWSVQRAMWESAGSGESI